MVCVTVDEISPVPVLLDDELAGEIVLGVLPIVAYVGAFHHISRASKRSSL